MIDLIGVPFDLCGQRYGSRLGPAAIRLADLLPVLDRLKLQVRDTGDIVCGSECTVEGGLRNFTPLLDCVTALQSQVRQTLQADRLPLVVGGEHAMIPGAMSAALQHFDGELAVLWIDAHADVNTPGTSVSGNIHGMPVAALQGLPSGTSGRVDEEWKQLREVLGTPTLRPECTAWFGLRDVDPPEAEHIRSTPADLAITIDDIDRRGIVRVLETFDEWLRSSSVKNLWISFDVDVLDPILAPGTGTAVRGGLTYREAHLCAEILREMLDAPGCPYQLAGVDLVETNPLVDTNNETAKMAVEWLASLFGKSILGKR